VGRKLKNLIEKIPFVPGVIAHRLLAISISLFAFLGLGAWSLASPIGSSPDEDYHLVSIWCGQGERSGLCEPGGNAGEVQAPTALIISANCFAFKPENSAACNLPPHDNFSPTARSNASGGYPPVFYWAMSFMASPNIENSLVAMRLFNAAVFILLITSTVLLSPVRVRAPIIGGVIATIVPLGMFLIPSVNPSSWAVISASVLWASLLGFFNTKSDKKRYALLAIALIATLIGSGSRTDAAVYSVIALAVAAMLSWRQIVAKPLLLLKASFVAPVSLFFYLTSGSSSVATPASISEGINFRLAIINLLELPSLWSGALGGWGLGWLDTRMPALVWIVSVFVFSGVVFYGLTFQRKLKFLSLGLLLFALTFIPLYVLVNENLMVGANVQPRYIYPLLIMIAGVSLWGIRSKRQTINRAQFLFVLICLSVANSVALHINIRRYVTGVDVAGYNLDNSIEWWWSSGPSPMSVWLVGSAAFFITLLLLGRIMLKKSSKEAAQSSNI